MDEQGISLWRQISETLLAEIKKGSFKPGEMLPSGEEVANRFGVNRHTAMRAFYFLQDAGVVDIRRGKGAFVTNAVSYKLGSKTRLETNLLENKREPTRRLLSIVEERPNRKIAEALQIPAKEKVVIAQILGEADRMPVNFGTNIFPTSRLPTVLDAFKAAASTSDGKFSITGVLADLGIADYRRKAVTITARPPSSIEAEQLAIPRAEYVLETEVVNVTFDDRPIMYGITSFASSRVSFAIEV